jgi:type IV secretory pathway VirB2 component (pilin)
VPLPVFLPPALVAAAPPPAGGNAPPTTTLQLPTDQVNPGLGSQTLPGANFLHQIAGSIGSWALFAAVIGIFVGGVIWAFGSYSQNYQQAYNGRKGVMVSALAALLIGAGPYLVRFFYSQGRALS